MNDDVTVSVVVGGVLMLIIAQTVNAKEFQSIKPFFRFVSFKTPYGGVIFVLLMGVLYKLPPVEPTLGTQG